MAELADALDLGSSGVIRVGSTPTTRTKTEQNILHLKAQSLTELLTYHILFKSVSISMLVYN